VELMTRTRLAPFAFLLALVGLAVAFVWYVLYRQLDEVMRIALGSAVLLAAAGVLLDPDRIRRTFTGRQARYGSNALLLSIAFLGCVGVAYYFVQANPQQVDLTEDREYSLAPESLLMLSELKEPVRLVGFFTPENSGSRETARLLLEQFRLNSRGMLTTSFVDPRADPILADRYGVTRDGTIVVVLGENSEAVTFATEEEISGAIVRLTNPGEKKVYFLVGHGERDINSTESAGYSQVRQALESKNYGVEELNLLVTPQIPEDALALVIAGPTKALTEAELSTLTAYLEAGGALVAMIEPSAVTGLGAGQDPLVDYLVSTWSIQADDDLVVDLNSTMPLSGIANDYNDHPITNRMYNNATYFPTARSLTIGAPGSQTLEVSWLVQTGANSWGETDAAAIQSGAGMAYDEGADALGPLTIAAVGEDVATTSRVVVIGDSDFGTNAEYGSWGNGDLAINTIDWATRQESMISLTPKQQTPRYVAPPTTEAIGLIFLITMILIPGVVIVAGIAMWWGRRKRT
jgi:ABC-type uncharacterized transport system involved in gliding motility auxiliary subunit